VAPSEPTQSSPNLQVESFADAIRRRNFDEAARAIDAAPEDERAKPEVRYARATVALQLGDAETALRRLDHLDELYPPLAEEVGLLRLQAIRESHDLTLLSAFFGASQRAEDSLTLAEASEHQGHAGEAELRANEALLRLARAPKEAQADLALRIHALLARLHDEANRKDEAIAQYRWLAVEAPLAEASRAADDRLLALGARLATTERLARAKAFSDAGRVEETLREVERIERTPSVATNRTQLTALVAFARYNARKDYAAAAQGFASAAQSRDGNQREYLYYEAKSLSRAQRDAEAIVKYRSLAKLGGPFAEHALFHVARLLSLEGDNDGAVRAYEAYGKAYPKARYEKTWRGELAVARLALGQADRAERELRSLAEQEKDDFERARLLELAGAAALAAGRSAEAFETFRRVIELRPLSFPALLAAAHLHDEGKPAPPLLLPAAPGPALPPLVVELPDKALRLHRVGLDELAEDALRSEERKLRGLYGPRADEALCRLYGLLESARRRYQIAQTAVSWSVLRRAATVDTLWQADCVYPRPYEEVVEEASRRFGTPSAFIYGVMRQESAFRPSVVSPAHAVGLMQIIPPTAERIASELNRPYTADAMYAPATNIEFGAFYLKKLLDTFAGRLELAAAAYNAGPRAVSRWLEHGEGLPLDVFVARIPYEETRNYVYRVLGNTARYAYETDGVTAVPAIVLMLPRDLRAPDDAY
jgi:soluble lytic murein transglycosylase